MTARPARDPADANAVAHVFVEALDDRCEMTGPDGHHLQRVRRLAPGEMVTAADGSGAWRSYEVIEVAAAKLTLDARGDVQIACEPRISVSLAVALTKGGLDDIVAAVTELGVGRVTPVRTARTVVRWDEGRAQHAVTRLRSIARASAMQSRRARIPIIDEVIALSDLVSRSGLVVAARDGVSVSELPAPDEFGWTVLVGPEGGLAPDELAILDSAPRLRLGRHVLRTTTAPLAAVAILTSEATRLLPE